MKKKVLYFPYINVPDSIWFTRILLYWDEVGAIIPSDYIDDPNKLNIHTKELVTECLVNQVIPGAYVSQVPKFKESFLKYLDSLGNIILDNRRNSFKNDQFAHIHIEKMDGLEYELVKMGLAKKYNYPWYGVETETSREFMSYLAATLGKLEELQFNPISDEINHLEFFINASTKENEISGLRIEILEDLFPAPRRPLKANEIRGFKDKDGDKLSKFRLKVEKELITIADINDPELKKRHLELFKDESREAIEDIKNEMEKFGFKNITLSKLASIISSIPGVSSFVGLANAVYNAFEKEKISKIDPCFLYAALAQKEILQE